MLRAARAVPPALTIAVGLLVSIAASAGASGGASALPVVRAAVLMVLVLAIAGVLGAVALAASPTTGEPVRGRLLDGAAAAAAVWTVAAAATVFLLYLGDAPAVSSPGFGPGLVSFVADVATGRTWLLAAAAAAVLTALLVAVRSRRGVQVLAVLSLLAVAPVAVQQGMTGVPVAGGRTLASWAFVQLAAIGTWIGAVALGTPRRVLRPACFAVAGVATAVAWPALLEDGITTAVAAAAVVAVVVAGALSIVGAVRPVHRVVAATEAAVLAAGAALGVVATATATLPVVAARTTPAEILTGAPLPSPASIGSLLTAWSPDPVWVVVAGVLLVGHLAAVRRLHGAWPAWRTASWIVGLVLLVWLTNGGPARYQELDLGVHLAQHAALLLLVPVLLAGGAAPRLPGVARDLRAVRPVPALLVALAAAAVLYGTDALRWSITDPAGTDGTIAASLLLGAVLVHALARPGGFRRSAIVAAVALLVVETGAAAALGSGSALLLADWYGAMGWGTDALAAQRLGALAAWPVAAAPTVVLLVAALRAPRPAAAPLTRAVVTG